MEFWSSRDLSGVLDYGDYRNFEGVIEKAKLACFNSGHRLDDHFVDVTDMIEVGKGAKRLVKALLLTAWAAWSPVAAATTPVRIYRPGSVV